MGGGRRQIEPSHSRGAALRGCPSSSVTRRPRLGFAPTTAPSLRHSRIRTPRRAETLPTWPCFLLPPTGPSDWSGRAREHLCRFNGIQERIGCQSLFCAEEHLHQITTNPDLICHSGLLECFEWPVARLSIPTVSFSSTSSSVSELDVPPPVGAEKALGISTSQILGRDWENCEVENIHTFCP